MTWFENAKNNLFRKSVEQENFTKALSEFIYIDVTDNQDSNSNCELCNQPNIRYEYLVRNKKNQEELLVGSECIKKFVNELQEHGMELLDKNNSIVTENRIDNDKKNFFKNTTLLLIRYFWQKNWTKFRLSLLNTIENNEPLTMNQAKHLKDVYNFGKKRDSRYETAMKNTIKISLKKAEHKYQWKGLNDEDKQFVKMFLSSQQKMSVEELESVGKILESRNW